MNGASFSTELERQSEQGVKWYFYQMDPVYNKDGSFYCVKIYASDITERKLAELDVKASNIKLMSVLNTTADSVFFLSKDYKVLLMNDVAGERIRLLLKKDISIGDDFREYIFPGGEADFIANFERALAGEKYVHEYHFNVFGQLTWFKSTFSPVYNSDGTLFGVSVFASNINEQKLAELALMESEEKFRKIVESAANPIIIIDSEMKIQMINSEVENVFGYQKGELIGCEISMLIPERFRHNHANYQSDYLKNSQPIRMGINRHTPARKKNGEEITIEASLNTFEIGGERFVLLIVQDVTHRIQSEKRLIKTNQELLLLNRINDLTLVIDDKEKLLNEVCRELVNTSKYRLAWVCRKQDIMDPEGNFTPLVAYGETNYVKEIKISLNNSSLSRGPSATAIRFEKTVVTNNVNRSDDFRPWSELAKKYGIAASLVLPLRFDRETVGCINIYSEHVDAFDRDELEVLERMARNISLTMCNISINAEKEASNYSLNERIKELKTIYQVNAFLQNEEFSQDELFDNIVKALPKGFQFIDICHAKLEYDGRIWKTKGYKPSIYKLKSSFETLDNKHFEIEVVYDDQIINAEKPVFMREEYDLIYAVKELIKVYFNKSIVARQLQMSERNLLSVFENTSVGHLLMDKDLKILAFNNMFFLRYLAFTGMKMEVGGNFKDILLSVKLDKVNRAIEKVRKTHKVVNYETIYQENGESKFFNISIHPVLEGYEISGFSMSAIEITDLKKFEGERQQIINNLTLRNRDLEQFAYIVSHNLRSPLVNILGIASLFNDSKMSEEDLKMCIKGIKQSAERLDHVVHDLNEILNVRRTGKESWNIVNLDAIIEEVKESFDGMLPIDKALINTNFKEIREFKGIKAYVHSILYNLISNSIKYARENVKPRIDIWTEKKGDKFILNYIDNSQGIDIERYKDQLFGLYKRFDISKPGKGMGLFLVKNQVEVMGGKIEIESELGVGTKFKIQFEI